MSSCTLEGKSCPICGHDIIHIDKDGKRGWCAGAHIIPVHSFKVSNAEQVAYAQIPQKMTVSELRVVARLLERATVSNEECRNLWTDRRTTNQEMVDATYSVRDKVRAAIIYFETMGYQDNGEEPSNGDGTH